MVPPETPVEVPDKPGLPEVPRPVQPRPGWQDMPEVMPFPRRAEWPEVVIEGSLERGRPRLRVRRRLRKDGAPRREGDGKAGRRGIAWAMHRFITDVWGEVSDWLEIWELMQANMYTADGTRLSAIRGPLDPVAVMRGWIDGSLTLDEVGFLRDYAVNQLQDEVIGRISGAITKGELSVGAGSDYGLTINQRLNSLRRLTAQIEGGF